ncbi:hypothetical protein [Zoogloea sp.]|uniref:hypothetical protein n=1 Tax=Zoogloea sp. TaxID=49181 RepID=UPI002BCE8CB9|nr:hypothetical protein [Zoogloea sp.]HQA11965.1 hypothetical protein [Zoogloea sp.]
MTASTATRPASTRPIVNLKGKGKAARELAYLKIALLSFVENASRAETISNLRAALGNAPSPVELQAAKDEWCIGRIACRLPDSEFPKDCTTLAADKLEHARKLVFDYALPAKQGGKALPKGKTGRRTEVQDKAIRAANQAWSMIAAELGLGKAQTQSEADKKKSAKRATNANPVRGKGKAGSQGAQLVSAPTHEELASKPAAPVSSDDYVRHITSTISTLVQYDAKHARKRPTTHGQFAEMLLALKQEANKAANAYEERKAAIDALRAEREK